jgi:hypothetical protein
MYNIHTKKMRNSLLIIEIWIEIIYNTLNKKKVRDFYEILFI